MTDRRLHRFTVHAPIRFRGDYNGSGVITSISPSGCRVEQADTPGPVEMNCYLAAELDLSPEDSLFIVGATVRWAKDNMFGLEFVFCSPHDRGRLHQALARLSSNPPSGNL
jgi:hypothetical protein